MSINLNACDKACLGCVKGYAKKHRLQKGNEKFLIGCSGIPATYLPKHVALTMAPEDRSTALSVLDPVTWASENLDWHCLDVDGSVWKRKDPEEYNNWVKSHPGEKIRSRYYRPYQAEMLRCTSKQKVYRCGRQIGKSESIVVAMLYHLFTKPNIPVDQGFKIIVITPYQSQIDLLFSRCMELINSNPNLANSVKRHVKAPQYTIELYNGSIIRGFTAGTKSGNNAGAVRGQHAHMLVFDEADYLSPADMDSALSIITNFPDASIWMSSTPTGKREKFYQTCMSTSWKEFYYPSQANPMWDDRLETLFRERMTSLAYVHEVLAEFGEQEQGVFQNVYIQEAKEEYNYGSIPRNSNWIYTIGVDWNSQKIGTTICVVGYNPAKNEFMIVDRYVVTREGWTQLAACQKIADLNAVWLPDAIYIDRGYGSTQDEILRKYGFDAMLDPKRGPKHPDAKLKDVVKVYDFGSRIEIHDLITKQPIQKAAKPFLVENAVRRFEQKMFKYSANDKQLEKELQGYVIDRITQSGNPVFKASDEATGDHNLDALMLALVAFTIEKTEFGAPKYRADVAIYSGQLGIANKPKEEELPGSIIIKDDRKVDTKGSSRPDLKRTETIEQGDSILGTNLPAAHAGGPMRQWTWDGFLKDEPQKSSGRSPLSPVKSKRPSRRNI